MVRLIVETEQREVLTLVNRRPAVSWEHVDAAGHRHAWVDDTLPSLVLVRKGSYWCEDCQDVHEEHVWQCRWCQAEVEVGYANIGPQTVHVPGRVSARLEDEEGRFVRLTGAELEDIRSLLRWASPAEFQLAARELFDSRLDRG